MNKVILFLAAVSPLTLASTSISQAGADEPVVTKVVFSSHTNDDDKDHDTGIYISVTSEDGQTKIAHADNRDNSGDDGTQYKDNSDHSFGLELDADGLRKSAAHHYKVHLWQHTNGHDTWKFNGEILLKFSDGTNLVAHRDGIVLENDGAAADWSCPN